MQSAFEQSVSSGDINNDACSGEYEDVKQGGEAAMTTDRDCMLGPLPGPSVGLVTQPHRDFSQLENWQMTEGSDHRDLLINLLFGGEESNNDDNKKQKKRKANATSGHCKVNSSVPIHIPTLPSWSNISNLASVGGVAVVEIEIIGGEDNDDTVCPLFPSRRIIDSVNEKCVNVWTTLLRPTKINIEGDSDKVTRTISTACKVKLFQDDNSPRCLSDVFMFNPPPPSDSSKAKIIEGHDIFHLMHNLALTPEQMRAERFPVAVSSADLPRTAVPLRSDNTLTVELAREKILQMCRTLQSNGIIMKNDHLNHELIRTLSTDVIIDVDEIATEKNDELSKTEHYVKTFSHRVSGNDVQRKIFAIDCEMVKTSSAYPELARVSVIMFNGRNFDDARSISTVVLDELVKPCRNVLDYITEYSGISAIMLEDIDTRIEDIQVRLLAMIDEDDIIVGHSLENDLRALRLIHDKVIDTSVIFRGANGRKFSLKHLSNVLLHRKIQCGSHGHCSSEDAEAALVLALRRARHGESFRLKENAIRQNIIGVFQKMNHNVKQQRQDATSFAERNDGACVCIGDNDWITKYAQSAEGAQHILSCNSILNTMVMAIPSWLSSSSATKRAGLLWANLRCEDRSTNGKKGQWKNEVQKLDELVVS